MGVRTPSRAIRLKPPCRCSSRDRRPRVLDAGRAHESEQVGIPGGGRVLYTATRSRLRPRAGCAPDGRVRGSYAAGGGARLPDRPQHSNSRSASPASPAPSETTSPPSLVRDDSPRHIVDHSGGSDHAARAPEHGRRDCDLTEGGGTRASGSHERAHIARERSMITVPHAPILECPHSSRAAAGREAGRRPRVLFLFSAHNGLGAAEWGRRCGRNVIEAPVPVQSRGGLSAVELSQPSRRSARGR